ncbi:hypothetical protein N7509_004178 [Penicillium cosmopolitanum]|uniref:Uncharacterized protein n=1 Tax=Penicillium cosmopolitanum TaxID=1131564 RepID=A0A9X0BC72_9EURO|nr:uncharacterized protein N7509_004178 [Penicillium cosmopolitanum]KAJ5404307.1 hypothetical protein N7509_004178 [Penicillium cosmopolitanum]
MESASVTTGKIANTRLMALCDPYLQGEIGSGILTDAAYSGHYETVRFLLETKLFEIESPTQAAGRGNTNIVDLLIEHGKIPTPVMSDPLQPLIRPVLGDHSLILEKLQRSMDLDAFVAHDEADHHRDLLMISAACGWNGLVEKLLQRGCSTHLYHPYKHLWTCSGKEV